MPNAISIPTIRDGRTVGIILPGGSGLGILNGALTYNGVPITFGGISITFQS